MNNKSCGCNKCMQKSAKCMAVKPACNDCKSNTWSDCNDNFDCNKFNNMMKKSNEITGCKDEGKKSCSCECRDCESRNHIMNRNTCMCKEKDNRSYACECPNSHKKSYTCECLLKGRYKAINNECAPEFACEVDSLPLGMGYVPYQEWNCNVSNACQGLCDGTIFPELVKPFGCTPCCQERRN